MLELDDIILRQGDFTLHADFAIDQGRATTLIGPSGGGKSTLLSAIAGFNAVSKGQLFWDGVRLDVLPPAERPLAMLFQDYNLFPHLTVARNVGLGLTPKLKLTEAQHDQVAKALADVGLSGYEARKPSQLSGGQQSRVALARVLISDRPIVLLDEPFAALGPALKVEMLDLVKETLITNRRTVLMVTHDPQDATYLAGQTVVVADGIAHAPKDTRALFSAPPAALQAYLGTT